MKRVALRIASVMLALSICFAVSANVRVPVSYTPAPTHGNTRASAQNIPTTVVLVATAVYWTIAITLTTVTSRQSKAAAPQSLERVDGAAQFDATS